MATEKQYTDDVSPEVQLGVTTEYPHGYAGPAVLWTGRLADLVANGGKVKLPKGFAPTRYAITLQPIPDTRFSDVDAQGNPIVSGLGIGENTEITISISHKTLGADGTYAEATNAAFTTANITDAITGPKYGLIQSGELGDHRAIEDDVSYADISASGAFTGNADIEVFLYLKQVDPRPEQMF